ncbi:MAG: ATP-binding protein [Ginsengibacter sp.]
MAKKIFNKIATRTRMGFFAAIFLLFISFILTFISSKQVSKQGFWIIHTNEVIHDLDNVISFISKAEAGFRGYILTNDNKYIATYNASIKSTDSTLAKLKLITIDNTAQQENLHSLEYLIAKKFLFIKNIKSSLTPGTKFLSSELEGNEEGIANTKNIYVEINSMKQEEIARRNTRSENVSKYSNLIQIFDVISFGIAILLTIYSLIIYNKENKAKIIASHKADKYKEELQERVNQLAKLNTELIELRRLEKYVATGRIARVIAHEVRNPLTNINLACEQLRSEVENENSDLLFSMINRNSDRINQLVTDLLATTRLPELSFSEISINKLIDDTLELATDRIKLNDIKLIKSYDENICPISLDVEKVKIAFLNIIVNAIEAMGENGILEITTKNQDGKCTVRITDNGKGMKKTESDRLFEPYFTTKEKGNGLGLANSHNIIISHKGSISAESEYGKGTSFTVSF